MDSEQSPAKRLRLTPPADAQSQFNTNADYIAFDLGDNEFSSQAASKAAREPSSQSNGAQPRRRDDPRNRFDRPKSKHALPGTESWILVRTKLGRRFVHNLDTKQSLWRVPRQLQDAVEAYDTEEEKRRNAQWSEEQLKLMRQQQALERAQLSELDNTNERPRRRRSESLQREDEEAMMAELAAQAEYAEEQDAKKAVEAVSEIEPQGYLGQASDSEYEYVEVTDTEGEGEESEQEEIDDAAAEDESNTAQAGPVDFGEDDIAYQLAMMGESYGLDPEEYGDGTLDEAEYDQEEEGLPLSDEEAYALFSQMLDEHEISPFTPWDTIIADDSASSIVFDDRYTVIRSSKLRKAAWDKWSRDRAAAVKAQRALEEKKDPRIAYLSLLARTASTKLYWPEFKRKFKREPEMNDRALPDRDRENYYRDLIAKLKSPEAKRRDELKTLLKSIPADSHADNAALPPKVMANVLLYALPAGTRDDIVRSLGFIPPVCS